MLGWFLPYINVNPAMGTCMSPPSWPSFPPHTIPLGGQGPGLSSLQPYSKIQRATILHMVTYLLQCHSLSSSHLLLPLLGLQIFSLHLHLYWCPTKRFISTIFLDSIYIINIWYLFFTFWLTSLCIAGSGYIHLTRTDSNS